MLTECSAGAQRLVASNDVSFSEELQPGLPPVFADKERVTQALLSLIARAVDVAERGTIRLRAGRLAAGDGRPAALEVRIIDADRLIPASRRRVLARVWRASRAGDTAAPGELGPMALGLALARRIVSLHGGEVRVAEGAEDPSLFVVTLPLDARDSSA